MQLACPRCQKQFIVPDSAIPPAGRLVKCSDCQFTWNALPEASKQQDESLRQENIMPAPDSVSFQEDPNLFSPFAKPLPDADTMEEDFQQRHAERRRNINKKPIQRSTKPSAISTFFSWVFVFGIIGGGLWSCYNWRAQIITAYPPAANVYQQFGLWEIPGYGMEISIPITKATRDSKGNISLEISGIITNNNTKTSNIPYLKGILKDDQGKTLYVWSFALPESIIEAGANIPYKTLVSNPPLDTQSLTISFITEKEKNIIDQEWHSTAVKMQQEAKQSEKPANNLAIPDDVSKAPPQMPSTATKTQPSNAVTPNNKTTNAPG